MASIYDSIWKTAGYHKPDVARDDVQFTTDKMLTTALVPAGTSGKTPASIGTDEEISIYDKMSRWSKGLGAFDLGMTAISAVQAANAKPPTVTGPKMVSLQAPKLESETEATNALIKENLGTGINTWLDSARERGIDPAKFAPGIFSQASRLMREGAVEGSKRNEDIINQQSILAADISNKETMINAELMNQYITRKDQAFAADAEKRGMQMSQAVSNVGGIASRMMNDQLMIETLKSQSESDAQYTSLYNKMAMLNLLTGTMNTVDRF